MKHKKKSRFPLHLDSTPEEWRQKKRQEWKLLVNALRDFEWGAGFTPVGADLHQLQRLVLRMEEDLQGEWVAW